jgi:glucose-6-phosphate isomerase
MTGRSASLIRRPEWTTLQEHYQKIKEVHLRQLFADDPKRGERLTAEAVGLYFDYSKHRITDETVRLLVQLARHAACASASRPCSAAARST